MKRLAIVLPLLAGCGDLLSPEREIKAEAAKLDGLMAEGQLIDQHIHNLTGVQDVIRMQIEFATSDADRAKYRAELAAEEKKTEALPMMKELRQLKAKNRVAIMQQEQKVTEARAKQAR